MLVPSHSGLLDGHLWRFFLPTIADTGYGWFQAIRSRRMIGRCPSWLPKRGFCGYSSTVVHRLCPQNLFLSTFHDHSEIFGWIFASQLFVTLHLFCFLPLLGGQFIIDVKCTRFDDRQNRGSKRISIYRIIHPWFRLTHPAQPEDDQGPAGLPHGIHQDRLARYPSEETGTRQRPSLHFGLGFSCRQLE